MNILSQLESEESFSQYLEDNKKYLIVLFFAADWSDESKLMESVVNELAKDEKFKNIVRILQVEAEVHENISIRYNVEVVPTFVFLQDKTTRLHTQMGANATELRNKLNQFSQTFNSNEGFTGQTVAAADAHNIQLETRLKSLINTAPVTLFMKGSPNEPKCGFSRQLIELLKSQDLKDFGYFDILSDQEVREALKKYSNWPTYPQLYVNGELIGGLDIVKELIEQGEFKEMLPKSEQAESLNDRLKKLVNKSKIMVFMKGHPNEPKCGFSRQVINILNTTGLKYDSFDILSDETVRQGLKEYSNWPTYPQIYVDGELVGGLDILKEIEQNGELITTLKGK